MPEQVVALASSIQQQFSNFDYNCCLITAYPPTESNDLLMHGNVPQSGMNWHKDNNKHLGSLDMVYVMGYNIFIDPKSIESPVCLPGWNLLVRHDSHLHPATIIPQEDNSVTLQPKGMQVGYEHKAEGVHSKFWRIVFTFRQVDLSNIHDCDNISKYPHTQPCATIVLKNSTLRRYVTSYQPETQGVTGNKPKVAKVTKLYKKQLDFSSWIPTVQQGGGYCCKCKVLVGPGFNADILWPCSHMSLKFGQVNVKPGTVFPTLLAAQESKVVEYLDSGKSGNKITGVPVMRITPHYVNNNLSAVASANPMIIISGCGGRTRTSDGVYVQSFDQPPEMNQKLQTNIEMQIPMRLLISYPFSLNSTAVLYAGLWYVTDVTYKTSMEPNSTYGKKCFFFTVVPVNIDTFTTDVLPIINLGLFTPLMVPVQSNEDEVIKEMLLTNSIIMSIYSECNIWQTLLNNENGIVKVAKQLHISEAAAKKLQFPFHLLDPLVRFEEDLLLRCSSGEDKVFAILFCELVQHMDILSDLPCEVTRSNVTQLKDFVSQRVKNRLVYKQHSIAAQKLLESIDAAASYSNLLLQKLQIARDWYAVLQCLQYKTLHLTGTMQYTTAIALRHNGVISNECKPCIYLHKACRIVGDLLYLPTNISMEIPDRLQDLSTHLEALVIKHNCVVPQVNSYGYRYIDLPYIMQNYLICLTYKRSKRKKPADS
jgi:hypothetical protein